MMTNYTIDAAGRTVGRIASEAASILMGKDKADFSKNTAPKVKVNVINASKTKISNKKLLQKEYSRFSGYPGGKKEQNLESLIQKSGYGEVFRKAVYGMLPKNKLRNEMLKNLKVTD